MDKNPNVTIVTICYNAAETIEKTILSVINQEYDNKEYLVIDGGSSDDTVNIIRKYANQIDYWVSEKDNGIYDAMNKGYIHSTGEWIIYVNSGDILSDNKALLDLTRSKDLSEMDIVYGDSIGVDSQGRKTIRRATDGIPKFREIPSFRHGAAIMRKSSMPVPPFKINRKEFGFALDTNLIYQMIHQGKKFCHINETILEYEIEGVSNNQLLIAKYNYNIFSQYGFKLIPFIQYVKSFIYQSIKSIIR